MKTTGRNSKPDGKYNFSPISLKVLEVYQQSLDYGDNWLIVNNMGQIFLSSHGLNRLLESVKIDRSLVKLFFRLIQYREVTHVLEIIKSEIGNITLWCCIEPITARSEAEQLLIVYFQPLKISKGIKLNLDRNRKHKQEGAHRVEELDIKNLDSEEIRILGWLKFGFTQQEISDKLSISRSSVVRKITRICNKLGLEVSNTARLRAVLMNIAVGDIN